MVIILNNKICYSFCWGEVMDGGYYFKLGQILLWSQVNWWRIADSHATDAPFYVQSKHFTKTIDFQLPRKEMKWSLRAPFPVSLVFLNRLINQLYNCLWLTFENNVYLKGFFIVSENWFSVSDLMLEVSSLSLKI